MEVIYKSKAIEDIKFWKKSGQKTTQARITRLIQDIQTHPTAGIEKPELLKHCVAFSLDYIKPINDWNCSSVCIYPFCWYTC
ncbi:MAG: type II toxin-antitoxin system YoeB family toxin [Mariniphaga sp.]|nr:type II toxin-antitoxin system YoeB family toxin [Mariniphaga sp.]